MRPEKDDVYLAMAHVIALRSTCVSRKVGCLAVDKTGRILSTGYNGSASGFRHCSEVGCMRLHAESGSDLQSCRGVHAEQNAIIQCSHPDDIAIMYCTTMPCIHCIRMILNTGCIGLVISESYPNELSEEWIQSTRWIKTIPHNDIKSVYKRIQV